MRGFAQNPPKIRQRRPVLQGDLPLRGAESARFVGGDPRLFVRGVPMKPHLSRLDFVPPTVSEKGGK